MMGAWWASSGCLFDTSSVNCMGLYAGLKSIFTNPYSFSLNSHFLWVCPPGLPHMSVLSSSADTGLGFPATPAALAWTSPGCSSLLFLSTTEPQSHLVNSFVLWMVQNLFYSEFSSFDIEICIAHLFLFSYCGKYELLVCPQYNSSVPTLSSRMAVFSLPLSHNRIDFYIWRRGLGWKCSTYFPQLATMYVSQLCIVCLLSIPYVGYLLLFSPHF